MKNLLIKPTQSSPEINFNFEQNILEFRGVSYPENTAEFYEPVFLWLEEYFRTVQNQAIAINIDLIYFNTSSSKVLMDFFFFF